MSHFSVCPNCGNPLKPGAISCPYCGSDEETGWKNAALGVHPDVAPFSDEDYQDASQREFGNSPKDKPKSMPWKEIAVGVVILALVALRLLRSMPK
ncbi:MAG TPA: zinc ribbon domain-containing protein [Fibrobacteraceae bacterium]|nr:zinc ribbon domain-containing protein [Fibrobacteraceae bacterium]